MFYIQTGNVKLTATSRRGKKAVTAVLRQGDFFGEGCLVKQSRRMSTATAIQQSTIARVKKATILRIIHQEPAFAKLFITYLLSCIGRYHHAFGAAVTLAIMGYHFCAVIEQVCKTD